MSPGDRPVSLLGVGYDETGDIAVMVLRETGGDRVLPIWISGYEGRVIEQLGVRRRAARPLAHEVLVDVVHGLGRAVVDGVVNALVEGIFHAEVRFDGGTGVDARPSDMVRVALTVDAPIYVAASVLDRAALPLGDAEAVRVDDTDVDATHAPSAVEIEERAARFRAWLDDAHVEDFDTP